MRNMSFTLFTAAICGTLAIGGNAAAQTNYRITDLPSLGGPRSQGYSINDDGIVAGYSTYATSGDRHATAWFFAQPRDLGTLGGPNSDVVWPVKNLFGRVAGISQTATPEPNGEAWSCSAFFSADATGYTCRGFVWEAGHMHMLPTLGGNNGFAAGMNNLGQVTGWAETAAHDPTCEGPGPGKSGQVLQFLPVIYGPGVNQIRALPLLHGDSSGAATAINDRGQAVGISGDCDQAVGRNTARHVVLWDHGRATDIGAGKLTAPFWNTPNAINERGDVVGFAGDPADPSGGITHAFIWTKEGGMQFLSNAPDDNSTATSINEWRQVSGYFVASSGALHGFVWTAESGMRDLNDLKPADYPNTITLATDINDFGVVTGRATDASGGRHAFVAVPAYTHP
jgi:uncharacterized membrane protein